MVGLPKVVRAYDGPWNESHPLHEAQQGTECGVHTLNNFNFRNNRDTGLLITKDTLGTFIWGALAKKHPNMQIEQFQALFKRETGLHATEYLVAFNNAHADQGFPPLHWMSGMLEGGQFVVKTVSEQADEQPFEDARAALDAQALVGMTFDFRSEEVPGARMPHTVMIERLDTGFWMVDSRRNKPVPLLAESMSGAVANAVARYGVSVGANDALTLQRLEEPALCIASLLAQPGDEEGSKLLDTYLRQALPSYLSADALRSVKQELANLREQENLEPSTVLEILKLRCPTGMLSAADIFYATLASCQLLDPTLTH